MREWPWIIHILISITRRATHYAQMATDQAGISFSQHSILTELFRLGGTTNQAALSVQTYLDKSVISRQVINLENMGYLEKIAAVDGSEKKMVHLLEPGREKALDTMAQLQLTQRVACADMTEREKKAFLRYLRQFYRNTAETEAQADQADVAFHPDWPRITHYIISLGTWLEQESIRYKKMDGVPSAMKYILFQLYQNPEPVSFKTLEKVVMMEQSGTVKLIKRLETEGCLCVLEDETDKRKKNAIITEAGIRKAEFYLERFMEGENRGCHGMTSREKEEFFDLLMRYKKNTDCFFV